MAPSRVCVGVLASEDGRVNVGFALPLRTISRANSTEHWRKRAERVRRERFAMYGMARAALNGAAWKRATVTLTRVAPRMLDSDNLLGSVKAVRDGIADALQVNDRDPRVTWIYEQRRGRVKEYAVSVVIGLEAA